MKTSLNPLGHSRPVTGLIYLFTGLLPRKDVPTPLPVPIYQGADKSLARPGRTQSTATKLCFCKLLKNNSEVCPSNQASAAAMTSTSEEKWRAFNYFFSWVGLRTYQHPCSINLWGGAQSLIQEKNLVTLTRKRTSIPRRLCLLKPWERYCLFVLTTKRNPRTRILVT